MQMEVRCSVAGSFLPTTPHEMLRLFNSVLLKKKRKRNRKRKKNIKERNQKARELVCYWENVRLLL